MSFAAISAPARGAIWMVVAAAFFAAMNAIIRELSSHLPTLEIVFFRNLAALLFMAPWLARSGFAALRTARGTVYIGRAAVGLVSMVLWFSSLALMPLAEATALSFTAPLFVTLAAAIFFKETVGARRWSATAIGFLGAMIVVRPGFAAVGLPQALVLASAAASALSALLVKQLTRTEDSNAIVIYMNLYLTPISLVLALFVWQWPSLESVPLILALGLFATLAHQAMTRAFAAADASAVMPFDFARLPFVALIAWLAFGETPDGWTWFGAALIILAAAYTAQREAVRSRAQAAALVSDRRNAADE